MTRDEVIHADQSSGGMFAVIPSVVMKDPALCMSARMLYGVITWKCNDKAYCWASNRTLAEILGLSAKSVSALVSDLEFQGHIETEIIRDEESGAIKYRYIYPIVKSSRGLTHPIPKNEDTPPQNQAYPSPNLGGPLPENEEDIYEKNKKKHKVKDPPKAPQGAAGSERPKRRRVAKAAPDWKPERFEGFWRMYPVKKSKQAAIRAWDSLRPDDRLLAVMGHALQRQLASPEWQRKIREEDGQGIPYPASWINGRRWEDEAKPDRAAMPAPDVRGGGDCGFR